MSKDVEVIYNQLSRLDAMAQLCGSRINDQEAITNQIVQLINALYKTSNIYQRINVNHFKEQEKCQKIAIAALVFAVAAFAVALFQ